MRVVIIGSGLIGTTTAYFLARRGHDVVVLDRENGPGLQTSFANGALLTPSMSDPWNAPGCWRVLVASLWRDSALRLRWHALPSLASWGPAFLRNSIPATFERNARNNLGLALYSLEIMKRIRQDTGIEYGRAARGSLRIFRDAAALESAWEDRQRRLAQGVTFRKLSSAQLVEFEPALARIQSRLVGAIHYETDEVGDAYRFCVAMGEQARHHGVKFVFGTNVSSLDVRSGRVVAAVSAQQRFVGDEYVVAAGSYSSPLLRGTGIHVPVQPVKGYSITLESASDAKSLRTPVVDDHLHAAVVPLPGALRVAGTAEFTGYDLTVSPDRIRHLETLLREVLPQQRVDSAPKSWCGLRPMSADGVPIIGRTHIANLLVNTGHGHLGWSLAAGSGRLLADLLANGTPDIDPTPFAHARFSMP